MDLRQEQIVLLRKFAHLYDSGVPLTEALEIASAETGDELQSAISEVVEDLFRGSSLADAMARRADAFGPEIVGILRSGEQRGELGSAAPLLTDAVETGIHVVVSAGSPSHSRACSRPTRPHTLPRHPMRHYARRCTTATRVVHRSSRSRQRRSGLSTETQAKQW